LMSEAMHALGIPTTHALAVTLTGDPVFRDGVQPGAVFTRVARSHIRVGTFQYFAAHGEVSDIRALADHVIEHFYPAVKNDPNPYRALFLAIRDAQAALIARWIQFGFIHGVMNTDNMSVVGDTIDYGPCAFMDTFDPGTVYSAIDRDGRYAYINQPSMAAWNLARLAETLLDLIDSDPEKAISWSQEALRGFTPIYREHWLGGMKAKIGLAAEHPEDPQLIGQLLESMRVAKADFTLTFRQLADGKAPSEPWLEQWRARLKLENRPFEEIAEAMRRVNPAYIPRNHRVEWAINAAEKGDFSKAVELYTVLARPFDDQLEFAHYQDPPKPGDWKCQTFCGT
jgi:serine/tyrosine/threonine adenylyltransferase